MESTSSPSPAASTSGAQRLHLPPSSLVICSRNRPTLLQETVESVLRADELPTEIVVVDQSDVEHPTLGALTASNGCEIRYFWSRSVGSSLARNTGLSLARHDIIAFIDDDMRVAPDWYGALIRALLEAGPHTVVTGRVLAGSSDVSGGFVSAVHPWEEPRSYSGRINRDILATGHMALCRSAIEEVGGLDQRLGPGTRFPGAEDNDLGFRLLEASYRVVYAPDSVIYHRAWRTRRGYVPLYWRYGRGQGAFYAKHLTLRDRYMLRRAGQDFGRYLRLLPRRIWRRRLLELSGSTAFLLGIISGAAEWILTERGPRA